MRENTTRTRIERLMQELGRAVSSRGRIYFTGGVSAVLLGWREMTLDVDLKAEPEPAGFFEALPRLKDEIDINIELAAPDQFVPALPGWVERSMFIADHGLLSFYHYDFYGQALAKIERSHPRDILDVQSMFAAGLVKGGRLMELFAAVESALVRYPAVDAKKLRRSVECLAASHA